MTTGGGLVRGLVRMGRQRLGLGLVALALLAASAVQADGVVYKWTDAQNRVHYSDRPPPDGDAATSVTTTSTAYSKAPRSASTPATPATAASTKPAAAAAGPNSAEKKVAVDLAVARNDDCAKAKSNYDTYIRSRRLYRQGDNNERVYLTDAELDEARVNARREVDDACGPGQ